MSRQRKPRARKIKHELFQKCAELEDSPYWKTIFQGCSYGSFPQNMTFKNGILYHRKGRRKQPTTYCISADPEQAVEDMKEALRKEKNLISVDELTEKRIRAREKLQEITLPEDSEWNDVSKSSLSKNLIISTYVREVKQGLKLSDDEAGQLFQCLIVGIFTGVIGNDDIKMRQGEILEVSKIKRMSTGFVLTELPPVNKPKPQTKKKHNQTKCSNGWDKHCAAYSRMLAQGAL